ncbi:hypothetical protein PVNG_02852 [Plasmodium vivax North Korean]|uniref:PIR Superfamily Protein n=1 Tax=Plasmodium vivax North Korean TaxID=1035514 RepID=A0A0J9W659_PLAVI|nr:hypothetical protein PVNG_02852 [Plasmodium vivax North Korean]
MQEEVIKNIPEINFHNKLYQYELYKSINIEKYLKDCSECKYTTSIEPHIRNIVGYYKDYITCSSNNNVNKCCRFFQYWFIAEKQRFLRPYNSHSNIWDICISHVWK